MDLKPTMSPASSILNRGEWFGAAFSGSVPGTVTPTKKNRPGTCRAKTEESPGRSQIVRVPRPWSPVTWRTIACAPRRGQRSDHRCRHQEKPRYMNGGCAMTPPASGAPNLPATVRQPPSFQSSLSGHAHIEDRHGACHGVSRGTQRPTFVRKASYSPPNDRCSVGSSYATTNTWHASQKRAP